MTQAVNTQLPIGYWLKQVDNLLTEQINQVQTDNGVARVEWQVLNLLKELDSASQEQIFAQMRTFVDAPKFEQIILRFTECGWVEPSQTANGGMKQLQLSEAGQRQHAAIFATQQEIRERAMKGIGAEAYATVIRVLQQMAHNLGDQRVEML